MTDDQVQALVLDFLDARGGYVAGASERELFLMVKHAAAQTDLRDMLSLLIRTVNDSLRHGIEPGSGQREALEQVTRDAAALLRRVNQ